MDQDEKPPVIESLPTLVVDGVAYQVMFTAGTLLRLSRQGVDLTKLTNPDGTSAPWTIEMLFQCAAAAISYGKRKFTAEELAELIPLSRVGEMVAALNAAYANATKNQQQPIGKVLGSANREAIH